MLRRVREITYAQCLYPPCLVAMCVAVALSSGCKKATIDDVEGWISAGQLKKAQTFVASQEESTGDRVTAIEKFVDFGQTTALQEGLADLSDRATLVKAATDKLIARLAADKAHAEVKAKDALFVLLQYMDDASRAATKAAVATWGFDGLGPTSTREALIERIEGLQLIGQVPELGQYGVPVASWLLAHGVETQSLTPFLGKEATTPELQRGVIEAVGRLLKLENLSPPWKVVEMASRIPLPETVALLIDIYLKPEADEGFRSSALGAAQGLISGATVGGKPGPNLHDTPEERKAVLAALARLMTSTTATDRWDAAELMFTTAGVDAIDPILTGLKADIELYSWYLPSDEVLLPDYAISDFCKRHIKPIADPARPVLEAWLAKGDRMQKSFAILCLKLIGNEATALKLGTLTSDSTKVEELFFPGGNDTRNAAIAAGSLMPLTVGLLATNALEGIAMFDEVRRGREDKTLKPADADARAEAVLAVFAYTGDVYKQLVQRAVDRKKAGEAGDANDAPPAPPPAPPDAEVVPEVAPVPDGASKKAERRRPR
jgi:hypothetical protein